jgi:hypothetical protein
LGSLPDTILTAPGVDIPKRPMQINARLSKLTNGALWRQRLSKCQKKGGQNYTPDTKLQFFDGLSLTFLTREAKIAA